MRGFIIRAHPLADIAPPYRVKFSHKLNFKGRKLALPLRNGGKAIIPLAAQYSGRTGTTARTAPKASPYLGYRSQIKKIRGNIGKNVGDKNVAAIFFVY